jgi:hypothetical protein
MTDQLLFGGGGHQVEQAEPGADRGPFGATENCPDTGPTR